MRKTVYTFLTGAVPNPPDSGKEVPKARLPMVTLNLKYDRYEEDINPWRIESLTSIYKSKFRSNDELLFFLYIISFLII